MPVPNNNSIQPENDWGRELEKTRLKNLKHQHNIGAPVKTANTLSDFGSADAAQDSKDWSRQLEQNRMKFALTGGMALPGPGAAAGAGGGISSAVSSKKAGSSASVLQNPKAAVAQHGFIGGFLRIMGAVTEEATKPVLKTLINAHWDMLPGGYTTLVSLFVTGPAINMWFFYAHIWRKPGLCKFDPFDMLAIMTYNLIILLLVGIILVAVALAGVTILCISSPSDCPAFVVDAASMFL